MIASRWLSRLREQANRIFYLSRHVLGSCVRAYRYKWEMRESGFEFPRGQTPAIMRPHACRRHGRRGHDGATM